MCELTPQEFEDRLAQLHKRHSGNKLGEGGMGAVYSQGEDLAIKVARNVDDGESLFNEVCFHRELMAHLPQGAVGKEIASRFVRVISDDTARVDGQIATLSYCMSKEAGNLMDALGVDFFDYHPSTRIAIARLFCADALIALDAMANRAVPMLHCDLKPQNVLVRRHSSDDMLERCSECYRSGEAAFMLSDYGLGMAYVEDDPELFEVGTPNWRAPETDDPNQPTTPKSDVYVVGLIAMRMAFNADDFEDESDDEIPDDFKPFLRSILQEDPDQRVDAAAALKTEFIQSRLRDMPDQHPIKNQFLLRSDAA